METTHIRVYTDFKKQLDNAIIQYRHNTGQNITAANLIIKLINDPRFKQMTGWDNQTYEQQ